MILLPAIDILDGRAVRLARGSFEDATVYDEDPVEAARRWARAGARALHVVDLDGARAGAPVNLDRVRKIVRVAGIPIQVGGGFRTLDAVSEVLSAGAHRVVMGTAAYRDVDLLDEVVARIGERLVVSLDARDGHLAGAGWVEQTELPIEAAIDGLRMRGVRRFVYSCIDRDGILAGPDLEGVRRVAQAVRGSFVYSGGVSSLDDLRALARLRQVNLDGVIVGRALYEQRFTVADGQAALEAAK
ncbi:MAG TPA: 1-(5-phosphoribosyl)-5-[(5-phosphoribosylamino)methylideneamino]imidazole-4-carboxamide isomerase [Solirubrobacteraceae bacterium]|nr:1-(5-phosphoribosyl)-5-[(5-phosphoribosylamino)methylideneamino]imidazole-4-carboxamide isomerase [Solirubrobacteraceae bacterium]